MTLYSKLLKWLNELERERLNNGSDSNPRLLSCVQTIHLRLLLLLKCSCTTKDLIFPTLNLNLFISVMVIKP